MEDYQAKFYRLYEQTYGAASIEKMYIIEEAVRLADAHNDIELGIEGRLQLIEVASFAACTDRSLPAMAWLLAKLDEDPALVDEIDLYSLMWSYKWIAANLATYPSIPLEKIDSVIRDMAERYDQQGYDSRAVESVKIDSYLILGDGEKLREAYKLWSTLPRGDMSDCEACEQNAEVRCHLLWGDVDAALKSAKPLLAGRMSCAEVPYSTYGHLLLPMFDADMLEQADTIQRKSQKQIRSVPGERGLVGNHLAFLALTGQANRAVRILDNNLAPALAMTEAHHRCWFFTGAAVLARTIEGSGKSTIKLKEHKGLELERDDKGTVQTQALGDWFEQQARDIARHYDDRAGTSHWSDYVDTNLARVGTMKPIPDASNA